MVLSVLLKMATETTVTGSVGLNRRVQETGKISLETLKILFCDQKSGKFQKILKKNLKIPRSGKSYISETFGQFLLLEAGTWLL